MKRQWHHPETQQGTGSGRRYWRSLGELEDTPEFRGWLEREFPRGAAELSGAEADEVSRRGFLKLMGASSALAGLGMAGCRRPEEFLVPYRTSPEWVIPGKALFYATAMPRVGGCTPLVATTYEGRPTKVDGNPLHPDSAGGSDVFVQASILNLYDPDRTKHFEKEGERVAEGAFDDYLRGWQLLANIDGGTGSAFLVGESSSPSQDAAVAELKRKYPKAGWYRYEPVNRDAVRRASALAFGPGIRQVPRFDRADKVLALDCDFLGVDSTGGESVRQFSKRRSLQGGKKDMNRLYVVEPAFTLTGGMADHRYRAPASQTNKIAILFAAAIAEEAGDAALAAAVKPLLEKIKAVVFNEEWIAECARDLVASRGKSIIVTGSRLPVEMQLLVAWMNDVLGSFGGAGATIDLLETEERPMPGIDELSKAIDGGKVSTLFVTTEADPVYDAPADLNFVDKFKRIETTVHLGLRGNATARAATWRVPAAHYLESWGDVRSATGVYSVIQPMIAPLYGGLSELELFLKILTPAPAPPAAPAADGGAGGEAVAAAPDPAAGGGAPSPGPAYEAVRETFAKRIAAGDVETAWNHTLRDGFYPGLKNPLAPGRKMKADQLAGALQAMKFSEYPWRDSMEVIFPVDATIYDGRYINNGWLQEVPDPVTKLTWDNAALLSYKTAQALGIERDGQMISVEIGGVERRYPALVAPGHADNSLSISLGYGQEEAGRVGEGTGFAVNALRTTGAGEYVVSGAKVRVTDQFYDLALTSDHYSMEGRALAREGTLERLQKTPDFARVEGMDAHIPENISLYKGPDYFDADSKLNANFPVDPHHQWGMTIDLNSCIGCNACVVACQAENNIPIVGKDQVIKGREMHWIRMDRYFSSPSDAETISSMGLKAKMDPEEGDRPGRRRVVDDEVEMLTQPVACVQCESAPCETVCPVNATVHSDDGLNVMAYNRCIGTRYCANNCPYKARRFNFFDYNKRPLDKLYQGPLAPLNGLATTTLRLQKNPNVTVRMRGVIEKCTYCVQRIQAAKIDAKRRAGASRGVQAPANTVTVACEQACPAEAIVFGNLKNPADKINLSKEDSRNYDLLKYVGTRPRTSYLARIRNPNMKMPHAAHVGTATEHMH